ncbi:MAG TPA: helix-turn-helix domain-containing protein [Acidimicrobiales bacterium]|nr:helix-turn-helix domain-containing protein [Acidimicrobiales bacterium]
MPVIDLRAREEVTGDDRIVDATLRCVARWGLAKTTLEDVAREAGISRATLYRTVPGGKDNLMALVSAVELNRFFGELHAAVQSATTLEDTIVTGVVTAARHLQHHGALKFMIEHEPEQILPQFAFGNLDRLLANVRTFAAPYLEPWLGADAGRGAEWLTRIVLSYACAPSAEFDLTDEASARRLVRTFVMPSLSSSSSTKESVSHVSH